MCMNKIILLFKIVFKRKHLFLERRIEHNLTSTIFRFKQACFSASAARFVERSIHRLEIYFVNIRILIGGVSLTRDRKFKTRADTRGNITCSAERTRWFPDKSVVFVKMSVTIRGRMKPCEFSRRKCAANPMQIKHPRIGSYLANTPDVAS